MKSGTGKFRKLKSELRERLSSEGGQECLAELHHVAEPQEYVGALMALLPHSGLLHWRGVLGMGIIVPALARKNMEGARIVMRRLMWHMNEESGNIGWGIPESMAEILSNSPELAKEFGRILFSYVLDSGREDNYIDHAPLLRSCFWAAGRFAEARPDFGKQAIGSFVAGLEHEDVLVRGQAALALCKLLKAQPDLGKSMDADLKKQALNALESLKLSQVPCEDFDGLQIIYPETDVLSGKLLEILRN